MRRSPNVTTSPPSRRRNQLSTILFEDSTIWRKSKSWLFARDFCAHRNVSLLFLRIFPPLHPPAFPLPARPCLPPPLARRRQSRLASNFHFHNQTHPPSRPSTEWKTWTLTRSTWTTMQPQSQSNHRPAQSQNHCPSSMECPSYLPLPEDSLPSTLPLRLLPRRR